jgi:UDP-glucuronate 4-epimerase
MTASQTALVTGCAGFIGSQLTESLLSDGVRVIGLDCFNDNYGRGEKLRNLDLARSWEHFEFVPLDLARGDLGGLVAESDVVFHLAAEPGVRASWGTRFESYVRNNVSATQHLLEAANLHPGRRLVFASSSSVYGSAGRLPTPEDTLCKPYSPYGVTKLAAEHMCLLYHGNLGVDVVALRLFSVFGPRQRPDMAFRRFCEAFFSGEPIRVFGDGEQTRDFTYVGDVVTALRAAATTPKASGRVYNIGGGNQVSVNQALQLLGEYAGRPLDVEYVAVQQGEVARTAADTTRARAELGFEPCVGISEGLLREFEWVREHGVGEPSVLRPR